MSVTKVAHPKRTKEYLKSRFNRPSNIVTIQRAKSEAKQESIHYGASWYHGFVRCNGCYDFAPFVHSTTTFNLHHNACVNCGSHQISYLSTSSGKLFGYLSKNI
ncbi:hypothetical protein [Candidatus Nitrosocosmicus sp. SS]|jgi:hypothetical protein|uniref:hypothetical protein n=1 Tax=Candidatus Nitrosocosmicus agrestis TaxID=2563600 RepID=UPI00122E5F97|nr:hypothetical protein [Candidatus Nitrosocosmicus sp. SS]KAA2279831.1 hypothetical protein F1Z66_12245 [Candidatus Nitrosocosmicus sp. SS]KAF0870359.1 hypothetical protein E5N71_00520 [Candidatus Nitrosocosmicus sp. SS]